MLGPSTSTSSPTSKPSNSIPIEQTTLTPSQHNPSAATTLQPTNLRTSSPTWQHTSTPSNPRPTQPSSSSPQTNQVPSLSPVQDIKNDTDSVPSHPPRPPTKSPLVQPFDSIQAISSPPLFIEENDSPIPASFDKSPSGDDDASSNSIQNSQSTLYSWSSTVNTNMNHLGGTFITIEISFGGSYPGNIGWQLISLDGSVNVSQPAGSYQTMNANAVIFESISLQKTTMTRSATAQEFSWSILSVRGEGLGGGLWKLYNGSPIDENLLAVGDDFSYMDTVGLAVTGDGIILLGDKQEQLTDSVNSEKEDEDKSMAEIFAQTRDSLDSDESDHIVQSEAGDSSRNLKVILMSVVLAAVFVAMFLFALAYRKKTIFDDDLTEDFDEWNVETAPPAEKDCYEDYYNTDAEQNARDDIQDSVSIDPPGSSFNGYEEKPPISNHTQQQLGTDANAITHRGTDVSEITTPSAFVEEETTIDIENLVKSTEANLETTFDIYTIIEKLESEVS